MNSLDFIKTYFSKSTISQRKPQKYDRIYIEWIDASASDGEWHSIEETDKWFRKEDNMVKQIGFFYGENETELWVVAQYIEDGEDTLFGHLHRIPRAWVRRLDVL